MERLGKVLVAVVSAAAAWYGSRHGWGFWAYAAAWFSGFVFALSGDDKDRAEWRGSRPILGHTS